VPSWDGLRKDRAARPEELGLARARREHERASGDRDEDLPRALLLHLATLLEGLLVEDPDHIPRALVDDDLFLPELLTGRRHAISTAELRERDLEDASQEIPERIPGVSLSRRLRRPHFGHTRSVGEEYVRNGRTCVRGAPRR